MTVIASDFDKLFGETLNGLYFYEFNKVSFSLDLQRFIDSLEKTNKDSHLSKWLLNESKCLNDKLIHDKPSVWNSFENAVILQEQWRIKKQSLSPDFEIYFGFELGEKWVDLSNFAWEVINKKYNPLANGYAQIDSLEILGTAFQSELYASINQEKKKLFLSQNKH